jgi:hypothetical protein
MQWRLLVQTNPVNGTAARCALTGKGIRYWDVIPVVFGLDPERDRSPCPFKGDAYQWMRNVVLAHMLSSARGVSGAVIAAYAEHDSFNTAKKVREGRLGHAASSGIGRVTPLPYQSIVHLAQSLSTKPSEWHELAQWVERKITTVASRYSLMR